MNIAPGQQFEHQDYPADKRRRKFTRLCVDKVTETGAVVAHYVEDKKDGEHWPRLAIFLKGLDEKDARFL